MSVYQFGNGSNWEPFFSTSLFAQEITNSQFQPIPEVTVPIVLDSHVIATLISSASARETWRFGGFLNQKIPVGLVLGGTFDVSAIARKKLWLNRISLQIFPKLTDLYAISFEIPYWFRDVYINTWKYIGPIPDANGTDLTEIQADLKRIEQKVNTILTLEGQ